ncbi:MAG TPA: hypothetical protein VEY09_18185 [Pyrinomonadaceae bacterium]|nr:hypothetical protein [Pyrinomonadaceae bacterium]
MPVFIAEAARYRAVGEILKVVRAFEARTLPRDRWDHAAHLTVALWYLLQYEWAGAVARVRRGIMRLNEAHGLANSDRSGYHETLTIFWLRYVGAYLAGERNEGRSLVSLANELAAAAPRDLPLEFYSRGLLFSPEARARWAEPDLKPLEF